MSNAHRFEPAPNPYGPDEFCGFDGCGLDARNLVHQGVTSWPIAIDPIDCGCTECLTGQYVPLNEAFNFDIMRMIRGEIADNIGEDWTVITQAEFSVPGRFIRRWTTSD